MTDIMQRKQMIQGRQEIGAIVSGNPTAESTAAGALNADSVITQPNPDITSPELTNNNATMKDRFLNVLRSIGLIRS